jgi:hypothetical protein
MNQLLGCIRLWESRLNSFIHFDLDTFLGASHLAISAFDAHVVVQYNIPNPGLKFKLQQLHGTFIDTSGTGF